MKILEVKNLGKVYGTGETQVDALKDVSFSVEKGEFVAIIGPSGSGKSTLLHIIGGVDAPTSGTVVIGDTDIAKLDETALAIFRRRHPRSCRSMRFARRRKSKYERISIAFRRSFAGALATRASWPTKI